MSEAPVDLPIKSPLARRLVLAGRIHGRLFRQGRASISEELAGIFERLGFSAQRWQLGMEKLRGDRLFGRFFAASAVKLQEIAERLGVRHLVNLTGCPMR